MFDTSQVIQPTVKPSLTPVLSGRQMQGLRLLAKSLPELRAEIVAEMSRNPAIEDVENTLEKTPLSTVEKPTEETDSQLTNDYDDGVGSGFMGFDEAAAERRQRFFDNQVQTETLQQHLTAQLPFSGIATSDWPIVEMLVGDLDEKGYYRGSLADAQMAFGRTEEELVALLEKVSDLDPTGCGARTPKECLLAQIDKLDSSPHAGTVIRLIEDHLEDIGAGRDAAIQAALGITPAEYQAALTELRTLDPHPGRRFPGEKDRVEYVNPEIHAVKCKGHWEAVMDARSLPEIRLSKKFSAMLNDPKCTPETKAYVHERIAAAEAFRDSIIRRQETVENIAQLAFDRQQDFFEQGFKALKPLTETEVAKLAKVDKTTVSRTVRDKYVATPFGTVELRRFFVSAIKTTQGVEISQKAVQEALKEIINTEPSDSPHSDEKLKSLLNAAGYPIARRTVAKYRKLMKIPGAAERRKK